MRFRATPDSSPLRRTRALAPETYARRTHGEGTCLIIDCTTAWRVWSLTGRFRQLGRVIAEKGVKNCRVHPTHWLDLRTQATVEEGIPPECVLAFEAVTKDGLKLKDFPACIDNLVVVTEAVLNKPESFADAGPAARDSILIQSRGSRSLSFVLDDARFDAADVAHVAQEHSQAAAWRTRVQPGNLPRRKP